ncbi:MAG: hypothetical protein JW863_14575 [Chitinispirillaceae bacterium]|nr:hypothetical protein [Chitinispirillaceae bacterium]
MVQWQQNILIIGYAVRMPHFTGMDNERDRGSEAVLGAEAEQVFNVLYSADGFLLQYQFFNS